MSFPADIYKWGLAQKFDPRLRRDNLFNGLPVVTTRGMGFGSNGTNLSNGTDTQATYRTAHIVQVSSADFRLVYGNFYNGATVGLNDIMVKVSLDAVQTGPTAAGSGGSAYQVSFGGLSVVTIAPGRYAVSDPIPRNAILGNWLYARTRVSVANVGEKWPLDMALSATNSEGYAAGSDATGSGASVSTTGPAYGPLAILGSPASGIAMPRTWGLAGDSIGYGAGDDNQAVQFSGGASGFFYRACVAQNIGYVNVAHPGETGASYGGVSGNGYFTRLPLLAGCTHVLNEYGHNDIYIAGASLATLQASTITIWNQFSARGIKAYGSTLTPTTTSTDGWATLGNQAITSGDATRVSFNDWVRDGAPMLNGVAVATGSSAPGTVRFGQSGHPAVGHFELADTVESSRNSGKWGTSGARAVTDAAINSSSGTLTSATANFTAADRYRAIVVQGAGSSGAALVTYIGGVTNSTTVTLNAAASTTVSGASATLGILTKDGTHPAADGHALMGVALDLTA